MTRRDPTTGDPTTGDPTTGDPIPGDGVSVRDLTVVTADGAAVLDGVDLELAPGSATALVGVSGAGKTTLALALLGRLRPGLRRTRGAVRVAGIAPLDVPPRVRRAFRRRTIAWLGQDPAASLSPTLRVADLVGEAAPGDRAARRGHVREALESVDLPVDDGFLRRYPHQISGGQQRRVALARALVRRPRVLVLDEPVTGLDPASRARVVEEIGAVHRSTGATLLVVGHVGLPGLTARTVVLDRGRVVDARATVAPQVVALRVLPRARPARLVVTDLRADHGGHPVLDGVGFALAPGECLALTGPSGIGKTTLARAVLGLHVPDGGQVRLAGVPLAPAVRHRSPFQRRAIGYVPQDPVGSLNPARSVGATLAHAAGARPDRVAQLLDAVGLDRDLAGRRPGTLSGGQRQRVALARALAANPQVLVCDEVTSALDPSTGAAVLDLLDRLRRERDLAILLITHDRDTAGRVATGVLEMTAGVLARARPDREVADVHRS